MPDTLEAIKRMFDEAEADEKSEFLFTALQKIDENMKAGFREMKAICECRKKVCNDNFVTKTQARIFGLMILLLSFGFGLGAGWITFSDTVKVVIPKILP